MFLKTTVARCGVNKEEIEKVDDLCAFRGVAQLGLGVPFFLSPPCHLVARSVQAL